jgi:hypothetical protein
MDKHMNTEFPKDTFGKLKSSQRCKQLMALLFLSSMMYSTPALAIEDSALVALEGTSFNVFEIADTLSFPSSKKIYIEPVEANFSSNWMREFKTKTSSGYRDSTLDRYAESLQTHIGEKLAGTGWTIVNTPEDSAIRISAKVLDLTINAPEITNTVNALVLNMGAARLELAVFDANNTLGLRIEDARVAGSPSDSYIETNRALNFTRFDKMFGGWANDTVIFLNIISEL